MPSWLQPGLGTAHTDGGGRPEGAGVGCRGGVGTARVCSHLGVEVSEFLQHFNLVATLNGWSCQEKGLYLRVSLGGSTLKILELVDMSGDGGYQ